MQILSNKLNNSSFLIATKQLSECKTNIYFFVMPKLIRILSCLYLFLVPSEEGLDRNRPITRATHLPLQPAGFI